MVISSGILPAKPSPMMTPATEDALLSSAPMRSVNAAGCNVRPLSAVMRDEARGAVATLYCVRKGCTVRACARTLVIILDRLERARRARNQDGRASRVRLRRRRAAAA